MPDKTETEKWNEHFPELKVIRDAREILEEYSLHIAESVDMGDNYYFRYRLSSVSDFEFEKMWMKKHGIDTNKLEAERRAMLDELNKKRGVEA